MDNFIYGNELLAALAHGNSRKLLRRSKNKNSSLFRVVLQRLKNSKNQKNLQMISVDPQFDPMEERAFEVSKLIQRLNMNQLRIDLTNLALKSYNITDFFYPKEFPYKKHKKRTRSLSTFLCQSRRFYGQDMCLMENKIGDSIWAKTISNFKEN